MRKDILVATMVALGALPYTAVADNIAKQTSLCDLSKAATSAFTRNGTSIVSSVLQNGLPAVTVKFGGYRTSFGQDFTTPKNWSSYNVISFKLTNLESHKVNFKFFAMLRPSDSDFTGAVSPTVILQPGQSKRFTVNMNVDDLDPFGISVAPPIYRSRYQKLVSGTSYRDVSKVYHWKFSIQDTASARVVITDMRLIRQGLDFSAVSDRYGQYTDRTWPDKILSDADFAVRKAVEATDLAANPGTGETTGTTKVVNEHPVPGKWAVVTLSSGNKYLQHPNGKLFWSLGVSAIVPGTSTPVQTRESYFPSLPSQTGSYASCWSSKRTPVGTLDCYDFFQQNLMKKYGSSFMPSWVSKVKQRLKSWGFNTIGIQSDDGILDDTIPFTEVIYTSGFKTRLRVPHQLWGSFPDPFASGFRSWCTSSFASDLQNYISMKSFMGVYVDNELSWGEDTSDKAHYNVPLGALTAPSSQPAKIWWVGQLTNKYGSISALNSAWGSSFSSWNALLSNTSWKPSSSVYKSGMAADFRSFIKSFASKYYSNVKAALDAAGVKALYLGSRFDDYNDEVVSAADDSVDVLSFTMYRFVDQVPWDYLNGLSKPVIFSEFTYAVQERGTWGGQSEVCSHQERVDALHDYLAAAQQSPNIIGVQWYRYSDQPLTGRWSDFENGGNGLVDVADTPYQETIDEFRDFAKSMYSGRN